MGFEDEILGRVQDVQQEQYERERALQEYTSKLKAEKANDTIRRNQACLLGKQAADLLVARSIQTQPIWNYVKIGETKPRWHASRSGGYMARGTIQELQVTGQGWAVLRQVHTDKYREYPSVTTNYALSTDGSVTTFWGSRMDDYRPPSGSAKTVKGIIHTSELSTDQLVNIIEGEPFKKGVASLIAGLGVYEWRTE